MYQQQTQLEQPSEQHHQASEHSQGMVVSGLCGRRIYDLAGQRSIGAYTGLYYFASSLAVITGPILAGRLIDWTSYRSIWPFCLIFLALAMVLMTQVRTRRIA